MSFTLKKIREASYYFQQIEKNTNNQEIYEFNLSAFINSARNTTWAMEKEGKNKKGFIEWYGDSRKQKVLCKYCGKKETVPFNPQNGTIQFKMQNDPIMILFSKLRTYTVHKADDKISENMGLQSRHLMKFDGKGGCEIEIRNRFKEIIEIRKTTTPISVSTHPDLFEKMYFFEDIKEIRNKIENLKIKNITDLAFEYYCKLANIVEEYSNKFESK
jgi:hypothetical protein